jgi:hypothetical protein
MYEYGFIFYCNRKIFRYSLVDGLSDCLRQTQIQLRQQRISLRMQYQNTLTQDLEWYYDTINMTLDLILSLQYHFRNTPYYIRMINVNFCGNIKKIFISQRHCYSLNLLVFCKSIFSFPDLIRKFTSYFPRVYS